MYLGAPACTVDPAAAKSDAELDQQVRTAVQCELALRFATPTDPELYRRKLRLRSLFKLDETWTVTEDNITCDIVSLTGRRRESWSIREIAQVRLRRILLSFGDTRYGLDLVLRSGKVLKLPAKRLRTTAERVKAEIEAAAGIG